MTEEFSQSPFCQALATPSTYANVYISFQIVLSFPTLFFVNAPYGKLTPEKAWTVRINHILGWFLMEASAWITFISLLFIAIVQYDLLGIVQGSTTSLQKDGVFFNYCLLLVVIVALYPTHYLYRSIIYPRMMPYNSQMDLLPSLLALLFNICNATLHANNILCTQTATKSLLQISPHAVLYGAVFFILSWLGCYHADRVLINLRAKRQQQQQQTMSKNANASSPSNDKYVVPTPSDSTLFALTYTPNYAFEVLQWVSFAVLTQHAYTSWLFVAATFANLFPRAMQYRAFYHDLLAEQRTQHNNKKKST